MPHQCVHCGEIYPDAAKELLKGCSCGSKFFYYINQKRLDELNMINDSEIEETLTQLNKSDKEQIEQDIRDITGMKDEPDKPVVLDLESVRVLGPGKFEIDLINLFSRKRPIIYRLEEGKYIIDLTSSIKVDSEEVKRKIRDPTDYIEKKEKGKKGEIESIIIGENKDKMGEEEDFSKKANTKENDADEGKQGKEDKKGKNISKKVYTEVDSKDDVNVEDKEEIINVSEEDGDDSEEDEFKDIKDEMVEEMVGEEEEEKIEKKKKEEKD